MIKVSLYNNDQVRAYNCKYSLGLIDVEFWFQAILLFSETFCNVKSSNCNGLDGEF